MRYSNPVKRIICVSLALILCVGMYVQHAFFGWASDDAEQYGSSTGVGLSLGDSGLFDAFKLIIDAPDVEVEVGESFDPLEGVRVYDGKGKEYSHDEVNLKAFNIDGCNTENPQEGTYTFELYATNPAVTPALEAEGFPKEFSDQLGVEVYDADISDEAFVRLETGSDLNVGTYSYINMTANLNTGNKKGRYITIEAPEEYGFKFDLNEIRKIADIEDMELRNDGKTLLLTINEVSEAIITMDFPVYQEITKEISEKLTATTTFTFTGKLYVGLSSEPVEGNVIVSEDNTVFSLASYPEQTLEIPTFTYKNNQNNVPAIQEYDSAAYRDGETIIEPFVLNLIKNTGMRSSYDMELYVPVDKNLVPVANAAENVAVVENFKNGESAFLLKAEDFSRASALVDALVDPQNSYTTVGSYDSTAMFKFTPQFSNLDDPSLVDKGYEAETSITVRIYQYGGYYDYELGYNYYLEKGSPDYDITYYNTPAQAMLGTDNLEIVIRPDYVQGKEAPYDDLVLEVTMPVYTPGRDGQGNLIYKTAGYIQPQSIKVSSIPYGDAYIGYELSSGTKYDPVLVPAGETLTFQGIKNGTNGIYVSKLILKPVKMDTVNLGDKSLQFLLYANIHDVRGDDGYEFGVNQVTVSTNMTYTLSSETKPAVNKEGTMEFQVNAQKFTWSVGDVVISPDSNMTGSPHINNYYLDTRPDGDQLVAYVHYKYSRRIGPTSFVWTIDASSSDDEFYKSLTALAINPGVGTTDGYISEAKVTYTTKDITTPQSATYTDPKDAYHSFNFANPADYLTSVEVTYTTREWASYTNYHTLFHLYMDLNKYKEVANGADLPSIQNGVNTLKVASKFSVPDGVIFGNGSRDFNVVGTAGMFYRSKTPQWISGNSLQGSMSRSNAQGGTDIEITLSKIITPHSSNSTNYTNGDRITLNNVTTYIPLDKDFYYVDGTLKVTPNRIDDYKDGDLSYSATYIRTGGSTNWLAIHWSKYTTGQGSSNYRDDPVVKFTVRSSPLIQAGDDRYLVPGDIYTDVNDAIQSNVNYAINIVTGYNAGGPHDFGNGTQNYPNLVSSSFNSNLRVLQAATYGIELFGGIGNTIYSEDLISYLNHEEILGVVKMNYTTVVEGGKEDGVMYIPIPGATGSHPGLVLAGEVDISGLPKDSSVAYTTAENPTSAMAKLDNWGAEDIGYSETPPSNLEEVTMVRIIGNQLDSAITLAYVPLKNKKDKVQTGNQDINLNGYIGHNQNPAANKSVSITWRLTDYKVAGYFWDDNPEDGWMSGKTRINGNMTIQSQQPDGTLFDTVAVSATNGYTALIPAYGNYEFSALAPGYKPATKQNDNKFDSNGKYSLYIGSNNLTVNAGFVRDDASKVNVVFVSNGGTAFAPQVKYPGDKVDNPDPQNTITRPDGATFKGWYEGELIGTTGVPYPNMPSWDFDVNNIDGSYAGQTMYLVAEWDGGAQPDISIENIDFGTHDAPLQQTIYRRVTPENQMTVSVSNAPAGEWRLILSLGEQFTMTEGGNTYTLPEDALIFYDQGSSTYTPIAKTVEIYSGTESNITKVYTDPYGVLAELSPGDVKKTGRYQATLVWSIEQAPFE